MKFTRSIVLVTGLAVLSGCSSEEELRGVAGNSVKDTLKTFGTDFSYKAVTGDGSDAVVFKDVTLKAPNGTQLAIETLTFKEPDLSPMLPSWYSSSDLATGFTAEAVTAENVTVSMNGMPMGVVADKMTLSGYDSTRKGAFRYSGYGVQDLVFSQAGKDVGRITEGTMTATNWVDGLLSPLKSTIDIKGQASLASTGIQFFVPGFPASVDWGFKGDTDVNLDTKTADIGAELSTNSFGNLSVKIAAAGVERSLVELLQASLKDQETFQRTFNTGSPVPSPEAQKIIDASGTVALVSAEVKGSGFEWINPILKMISPNREYQIMQTVTNFQQGFGSHAADADVQAQTKALYDFLTNPAGFVLTVTPEKPFVFSKEVEGAIKREGSPFKTLGVNFKNGG